MGNYRHHVISNSAKEARLPAFQTTESLQEKHKKWLEIVTK